MHFMWNCLFQKAQKTQLVPSAAAAIKGWSQGSYLPGRNTYTDYLFVSTQKICFFWKWQCMEFPPWFILLRLQTNLVPVGLPRKKKAFFCTKWTGAHPWKPRTLHLHSLLLTSVHWLWPCEIPSGVYMNPLKNWVLVWGPGKLSVELCVICGGCGTQEMLCMFCFWKSAYETRSFKMTSPLSGMCDWFLLEEKK